MIPLVQDDPMRTAGEGELKSDYENRRNRDYEGSLDEDCSSVSRSWVHPDWRNTMNLTQEEKERMEKIDAEHARRKLKFEMSQADPDSIVGIMNSIKALADDFLAEAGSFTNKQKSN